MKGAIDKLFCSNNLDDRKLYFKLSGDGMKGLYNKFSDKLSLEDMYYIKDNYRTREAYLAVLGQVKNLKAKLKEYEDDIEKKLNERQEERERNLINQIKDDARKYRANINELEHEHKLEVEELKTKLEKWKAMYTGQCEANRTLIEKLGGTHE